MRRDGEVPQRQEPRPRRRRLRRAAQPGRGWKHRLGRAVSLKELVGDQGSPGIVLELVSEICLREGQSCSWKRLVRRLPPTVFRDREMIPSNCGAANPRAFSDNSQIFLWNFSNANHWSQIEFEKPVLQKSTANIS